MRDIPSLPPFFSAPNPVVPLPLRCTAAAAILVAASGFVSAQTASPAPVATDLGQVEIRGNRNNDTEVRRESTASKIVIGREEIEKQGDATLGEVLKRLPGVSMDGGSPRLRGLGGGFLPRSLAQPYIDAGLLVVRQVVRSRHNTTHYAWRESRQSPAGQALRWWLGQLSQPVTRAALLQPAHRV